MNKFISLIFCTQLIRLLALLLFAPVLAAEVSPFFGYSRASMAALNNTGSIVALLRTQDNQSGIELYRTTRHSIPLTISESQLKIEEGWIKGIHWIDDDTLAVYVSETVTGIKDLLDTQVKSRLLLLDIDPVEMNLVTIRELKTRGWIIPSAKKTGNYFLYAKSGLTSKVYKIDATNLAIFGEKVSKLTKIDGGQFTPRNQIAEIDGFAIRWFFSNDIPIAVLAYNSDHSLSLISIGETNKTLKKWSKIEREGYVKRDNIERFFVPISLADTPDTFYCLDFSEEEERSVYKVNFTEKTNVKIYESGQHRIIELLTDTANHKLIGLRTVQQGMIKDVYFDATEVDRLEDMPNPAALDLPIGYNTDSTVYLNYRESHNNPGSYWITKPGQESFKLASTNTDNNYIRQDKLIVDQVIVEGLPITYFLTLPKHGSKLPLIVLPHGGPVGSYDQPYFDGASQFFADAGYAVLRVNFRGSGGYGSAHRDAAAGQWGKLMLQDIVSATQHAVKNSRIDGDRICVAGMSYGGYAATMLTIRHPEIFKCGATIAGVSDLALLINNTTNNERQSDWLIEQLGDPISNYDELKSDSPAYLSALLKRPMLIMHGDKDETVDIEHAYRLKAALEKNGRAFQWKILKGENHSFSSPTVKSDVYIAIELFIKNSLTTQEHFIEH